MRKRGVRGMEESRICGDDDGDDGGEVYLEKFEKEGEQNEKTC